ncbi:MAG: hypothetical protein ABIT68_10080, partial [Sphingomicrobium sp.]
ACVANITEPAITVEVSSVFLRIVFDIFSIPYPRRFARDELSRNSTLIILLLSNDGIVTQASADTPVGRFAKPMLQNQHRRGEVRFSPLIAHQESWSR